MKKNHANPSACEGAALACEFKFAEKYNCKQYSTTPCSAAGMQLSAIIRYYNTKTVINIII